jgi:hypothetical protein
LASLSFGKGRVQPTSGGDESVAGGREEGSYKFVGLQVKYELHILAKSILPLNFSNK